MTIVEYNYILLINDILEEANFNDFSRPRYNNLGCKKNEKCCLLHIAYFIILFSITLAQPVKGKQRCYFITSKDLSLKIIAEKFPVV